jgi:O-methyltransferase
VQAESTPGAFPAASPEAPKLYLDLLKGCLTRELFLDEEFTDVLWWPDSVPLGDPDEVWAILEQWGGLRLVRPSRSGQKRRLGRDTPPHGESMIGAARLDNVQELVTRVIAEQVPGDLVETGVWRGGSVILMRAVMAAYGASDRTIWAFDSFEGLPEPDVERYPMDVSLQLEAGTKKGLMKGMLSVTADQVRRNIERYGLLDEHIRIVEGWFCDTLPVAPIEQIAVLRLDGDLYQSTMDGLVNLEPKVVPGGFVIVDDYGSIDACRQAVTDYREEQDITAEIQRIDWTGVWWQKPAG